MSKTSYWILGTVVLVGGLHLLTLREGHEWGDDFSLYVAHARNLAEGRSYADTGYVYNPHFPSLSPRTYPPVFPALLVPVYLAYGLNLWAMKVYVVLLFAGFLGVFGVVVGRRLPLPYAVACLCMVGLNPFVWNHKDRLLSEAPFMLFCYLSLLLAEWSLERESRSRAAWVFGLLAGSAAFLAFGVRTVGVALLPTLLASAWLKERRLGRVALAMLAPFVLGTVLQKLLLTVDGSYLDQMVYDPLLPVRILFSLVVAMGEFVDNGVLSLAAKCLYLCLLLLAGADTSGGCASGSGRSNSSSPRPARLLAAFPYAEGEVRYLLPLLPLFFFYACEGLIGLATATRRAGLEMPLGAALALALFASYAARFAGIDRGAGPRGVSTPEAVALFDFIRTRTRPDDVFLFQKPRALALFTGRRASGLHVPGSDEELWDYVHGIGTNYVIVCQQFPNNRKVLAPFVQRYRSCFDTVYQNPVFEVYRVRRDAQAMRRQLLGEAPREAEGLAELR